MTTAQKTPAEREANIQKHIRETKEAKAARRAAIKEKKAAQNALYLDISAAYKGPNSGKVGKLVKQLSKTMKTREEIIAAVEASSTYAKHIAAVAAEREARIRKAIKKAEDHAKKLVQVAGWPRVKRYRAWGIINIRQIVEKRREISRVMFDIDHNFKARVQHAIHEQNLANARAEKAILDEKRRIAHELAVEENRIQLEAARIERERLGAIERKDRLKRLSVEADREAGQEYVQSYIPRELMNEFRLWCVRTYHGFPENLFAAADSFMTHHAQKQDEPAPHSEVIEPVAMQSDVKPVTPVTELPVKPKREGKKAEITTRPDQVEFTETVRLNCFNRCVISGVRTRQRAEAAHLVEHSKNGIDHFTNGLLMRVDLHRLFDAGLMAINPETLTVHFDAGVLADDPDLMQFEDKRIADTQRPIDTTYLAERWQEFNQKAALIYPDVTIVDFLPG